MFVRNIHYLFYSSLYSSLSSEVMCYEIFSFAILRFSFLCVRAFFHKDEGISCRATKEMFVRNIPFFRNIPFSSLYFTSVVKCCDICRGAILRISFWHLSAFFHKEEGILYRSTKKMFLYEIFIIFF